jgi:hypothetical protein
LGKRGAAPESSGMSPPARVPLRRGPRRLLREAFLLSNVVLAKQCRAECGELFWAVCEGAEHLFALDDGETEGLVQLVERTPEGDRGRLEPFGTQPGRELENLRVGERDAGDLHGRNLQRPGSHSVRWRPFALRRTGPAGDAGLRGSLKDAVQFVERSRAVLVEDADDLSEFGGAQRDEGPVEIDCCAHTHGGVHVSGPAKTHGEIGYNGWRQLDAGDSHGG